VIFDFSGTEVPQACLEVIEGMTNKTTHFVILSARRSVPEAKNLNLRCGEL